VSGLAQRAGAHELVHPVLLLCLALRERAQAVLLIVGQRAGRGAQAGALQEQLRRGLVQEDDSAVPARAVYGVCSHSTGPVHHILIMCIFTLTPSFC
jgi:hypothetical protein